MEKKKNRIRKYVSHLLMFSIVVFAGSANGIEFRLASDNTMMTGFRHSCGVVRCAEDGAVKRLAVYKQYKAGTERESRVVVAELSQNQKNINEFHDGIMVNGTLTPKRADIELHLFQDPDCHDTTFSCQTCHLDDLGVEHTSFSDGSIDSHSKVPTVNNPEQSSTKTIASPYNSHTALTVIMSLIHRSQTYVTEKIEHAQERLDDRITLMADSIASIDKSLDHTFNQGRSGDGFTCTPNNQIINKTQHSIEGLDRHLTTLNNVVRTSATQTETALSVMKSSMAVFGKELKNEIKQSVAHSTNTLKEFVANISKKEAEDSRQQQPMTCSNTERTPSATKYITVYPNDDNVPYLCDTDGGWTVIQRRINGYTDFYRDWATYKNGFGSLDGDFWLGNDRIHMLTASSPHELMITMIYNRKRAYARYSNFYVASELEGYRLSIGAYTGTAGDSLRIHGHSKFSTFDKDNDKYGGNCAVVYTGAWWYTSCHEANLNGVWGDAGNKGPRWAGFSAANPVTMSEMKIRPMMEGDNSNVISTVS